jgi:hypothetical protein
MPGEEPFSGITWEIKPVQIRASSIQNIRNLRSGYCKFFEFVNESNEILRHIKVK